MRKLIRILIFIIISIAIIFIFEKLGIYNKIFQQIYPIKYSEYVEKYAKEFNLDKNLIYAIIKAESNFNKEAKSNRKAVGLMQIMESTAIETADKLETKMGDLYDPETNIMLGTKYFSILVKQFNNNYKLALIAYNAGMGNLDKWIEQGIIRRRWF